MATPPSAELKRRWARAKLGALVWFFFGLLILLFALQHHRMSGWDRQHGLFTAFYAGTGVCWLISSGLLLYAAKSLKPRFSLRTLIVGTGLVAVVLAMVKFFMFDRWYYRQKANERAVALARQGDFVGAARIIDGTYRSPIMREQMWWAISRDLANRKDAEGAVLALSELTAGYTRDSWLQSLAVQFPPTHRQQFLAAIRQTMGSETESKIRNYYASLVPVARASVHSPIAPSVSPATNHAQE